MCLSRHNGPRPAPRPGPEDGPTTQTIAPLGPARPAEAPAPPGPAEGIGIVNALLRAETTDAVWCMLCRVMARAGFDRLNYAYNPAIHDTDRPSRSVRFTLTSHPDPAVRRVYRSTALDRSPMRRWAVENVGAISWARQPELLRDYGMEADGPALNALLAELGFHAGYTIGFAATQEAGKGALGLTARGDLDQAAADAVWAEHGAVLEAVAGAAHARLCQLPLALPHGMLTDRQRTILGWVADGKTVQDVAALMDRSVGAIEKQLREARARLGVETTAQAVARVALLNQLPVPARD